MVHAPRSPVVRLLAPALLVGVLSTSAAAQARPPDLGHATLEELMNVRITAAGRREQRAADAAAAVFVITNDDIRRSGLTSVPELLRLVPGVQVSRINGNKWAVSVRGFNDLYSNKLLVLVDGRSLYNHLFSGVLWDLEDLVLEDIDRIEVVRGPGGVDWGANAVNGVINIVTRGAGETRGGLVAGSVGTFERAQVTARYGGAFGSTAYRVFTRWSAQGESQYVNGDGADDDWQRLTTGFRTDWSGGAKAFTLEGSMTRAEARLLWIVDPSGLATAGNPQSTMNGGSLVARWTRQQANGATLQIQSFFDATHRDEAVGSYWRRVGDVDVQYHVGSGRHDVVTGVNYRLNYERFDGRGGYSLTPPSSTDALAAIFAQDQIALAGNRLQATVGARVEHEDLAGWNLQPTARLMWSLPSHQHLWAAVSHAVRTPSLQDRGIRANVADSTAASPLPVLVTLLGDPTVRNEDFRDVEAGYRAELASTVTVDVVTFAGRYQHLRTHETGQPALMFGDAGPYLAVPVRFDDLGGASTHGVEIDAQWTPRPWWRLDGSFTEFHLTPRVEAASRDPQAAVYDGDAPSRQWQLHSAWSIGRAATFDARLFRVGRLANLGVAAYTRADARVEVPLSRTLSVSFTGQNLLAPRHAEFTGVNAELTSTLVPRSAYVRLTCRF